MTRSLASFTLPYCAAQLTPKKARHACLSYVPQGLQPTAGYWQPSMQFLRSSCTEGSVSVALHHPSFRLHARPAARSQSFRLLSRWLFRCIPGRSGTCVSSGTSASGSVESELSDAAGNARTHADGGCGNAGGHCAPLAAAQGHIPGRGRRRRSHRAAQLTQARRAPSPALQADTCVAVVLLGSQALVRTCYFQLLLN